MGAFEGYDLQRILKRVSSMKISGLLVLCMLVFYQAKTQAIEKRPARNALYLELGGIGGLGSLNYERMIPLKGLLALGCGLV